VGEAKIKIKIKIKEKKKKKGLVREISERERE
jgi:hypothetical protein